MFVTVVGIVVHALDLSIQIQIQTEQRLAIYNVYDEAKGISNFIYNRKWVIGN